VKLMRSTAGSAAKLLATSTRRTCATPGPRGFPSPLGTAGGRNSNRQRGQRPPVQAREVFLRLGAAAPLARGGRLGRAFRAGSPPVPASSFSTMRSAISQCRLSWSGGRPSCSHSRWAISRIRCSRLVMRRFPQPRLARGKNLRRDAGFRADAKSAGFAGNQFRSKEFFAGNVPPAGRRRTPLGRAGSIAPSLRPVEHRVVRCCTRVMIGRQPSHARRMA